MNNKVVVVALALASVIATAGCSFAGKKSGQPTHRDSRPEAVVSEPEVSVKMFAPEGGVVRTQPANQFFVHRLWEKAPSPACETNAHLTIDQIAVQQIQEVENGRHRNPELD